MKCLWVVVKSHAYYDAHTVVHVVGIFSSEEAGLAWIDKHTKDSGYYTEWSVAPYYLKAPGG